MIEDRMPFEPAEPIPDAPTGICPKCQQPWDIHNWRDDTVAKVSIPVCRGNTPLDPPVWPIARSTPE